MATINKKQLVEVLSREIFNNVSRQIRELVREEIDIERRRLRRQLLEEFQSEPRPVVQRPPAPVQRPVQRPPHLIKPLVTKPAKARGTIDTGDPTINSFLDEIKIEKGDMSVFGGDPSAMFREDESQHVIEPSSSFREAAHQGALNEQRKHSNLWKPAPGEAYNFDPTSMDPTKIDWTQFMDALEERK